MTDLLAVRPLDPATGDELDIASAGADQLGKLLLSIRKREQALRAIKTQILEEVADRIDLHRSARLTFRYHHDGTLHEYCVVAQELDFGFYGEAGQKIAEAAAGLLEASWVLHAEVVTRDGDPRPDMLPTRRRTFLLDGMRLEDER